MKFRARTNNERKIDVRWDLIEKYVQKWKPGTALDIEIVRHQKKKSNPMRQYFFAVVLPLFAEHLGYDKDEHLLLHRQLKIIYFGINPDKKGIYRKVPHVFANESELPISEKKKYSDWVIRKAAIEGIYIPDPSGK